MLHSNELHKGPPWESFSFLVARVLVILFLIDSFLRWLLFLLLVLVLCAGGLCQRLPQNLQDLLVCDLLVGLALGHV